MAIRESSLPWKVRAGVGCRKVTLSLIDGVLSALLPSPKDALNSAPEFW